MNSRFGPVIAFTTRAFAALAVLTLGFSVMKGLESFREELDKTSEEQLRPPIPVFEASTVDVQRQWQGFGTAEALDSAEVPARVSATVVSIPDGILPGADVKKGQLLAELDASDFERQVEIAQRAIEELDGRLSQLQAEEDRLVERIELEEEEIAISGEELSRVQGLFDRNAASPSDLDNARRILIGARVALSRSKEQRDGIPARRLQLQALREGQNSNLQLAKQNLDRTKIVSPIDGVISDVFIEVGENLANGSPVVHVVNLEKMELPLRLPASSRKDLMLGDAVELQSTNEHHLICKAEISRISPIDDQDSRTVTVYTVVDQTNAHEIFGGADSNRLITPGMFMSGRATSSRAQPRTIVPRRAIQNDRILVVKNRQIDGKTVPLIASMSVEVDYSIEGEFPQFGLPDKQWAVLIDELEPGLRVVVNASDTLRDGSAISPILVNGDDESMNDTVKTSTPDDSRINGEPKREGQP